MYDVSPSTIKRALKPFDVVTITKDGATSVGFIASTYFSGRQPNPELQVKYSVNWLINHHGLKFPWFDRSELTFAKKNLMVEIAVEMEPSHMRNQYLAQQFGG